MILVLITHPVELLLIRNLMVCSFFLVLERPFSFELDTLTLSFNGNQTVPVTNLGIAWTTDKAVKFNNPPNPGNCRYNKFFFSYKKN